MTEAERSLQHHAALDARLVAAVRGIRLLESVSWPAQAQETFLAAWERLDLGEDPPGRDTWLGYHRDLRRLARLRALIDFVVARLGGGGAPAGAASLTATESTRASSG